MLQGHPLRCFGYHEPTRYFCILTMLHEYDDLNLQQTTTVPALEMKRWLNQLTDKQLQNVKHYAVALRVN